MDLVANNKIKGGGGRRKSAQRGFSLIEMSVVIVILGILSIGTLTFMKPAMDLMVHKNFVNGPLTEAHLAMAKMVRDTNQIKDNASISTASASQLTFTDVNDDTVSYTLSSGTMARNGVAIAKSVTGLQFTYYSSSNGVLSSPTLSPETNIHRIQAQITVSDMGRSATVRGHMYPRNV